MVLVERRNRRVEP